MIGGIVIEIHNQRLDELIVKRRNLQVILHDESELVIGIGPPGLQPLGLQAHIGRSVMHNLIPKLPIEAIDELQNSMRLEELGVDVGSVVGGEMVNVEMEVDAVGEVVGGGEGAEAAGERGEAVEGEELDEESERNRVGKSGGLRKGERSGGRCRR
ncbi:hypothetical protein GYH30_043807 [Glycine max]|nr:hypothetical protein GYH30_043807 [Glycine max]